MSASSSPEPENTLEDVAKGATEAASYLGGPDGRTHRIQMSGQGRQKRVGGKCDYGRTVRGRLPCCPGR